MKTFFLFCTTILASAAALATIRTVSNNTTSIAQFNDIGTCIATSNPGDTIEIEGSNTNYNGFTLDKQLTFIGPGWNPDMNMPLTANIGSGVNITVAAANGSVFNGLSFLKNINFSTGINFSNFKFIRNHFAASVYINLPGGTTSQSGFVFESNWFDNAILDGNNATIQNFLLNNNIFYGSGCCGGGANVTYLNANTNSNILFDHNLWYGPASSSLPCFASVPQLITLTNNIFIRRDAGTNVSNSAYQNNITFNTANDQPWAVNGNTNNGGNIAATDPQITDQASINSGVDNPLLNFVLLSASPAHNAGNDGKDMGLLYDAAGSLNWNNARNSQLPRIFSMSLSPTIVTAGGNIIATVVCKVSN